MLAAILFSLADADPVHDDYAAWCEDWQIGSQNDACDRQLPLLLLVRYPLVRRLIFHPNDTS